MMERDESAQPGVVLADSEIPMRTGLRTALEAAGFRILAETGDAGGAVLAALAHRPQVCVMAVGLPGDGIAVGNRGVELTARQYEVLEHLRDGDCTATIASRLGISVVTVRRHISAIMAKLGVADRVSALQLLDRSTASKRDR